MLQGFELVVQVACAAAAGDGFVEDGAAFHFFDVLAEITDGQLLRDGNFAFVRIFFACDHSEKRGLARAIRPYQTYFLAGVELE